MMPDPGTGLRAVHVFCDTADDQEFARKLLQGAAVLKGAVLGFAKDQDIAALKQRGISVQVEGTPGARAAAADQAHPAGSLRRRSKRTDPDLQQRFQEFKAAAGPVDQPSDTDWYRITFNGPLTR